VTPPDRLSIPLCDQVFLLPEQVISVTVKWLNEVDSGLAAMRTAASDLEADVATAIGVAVDDVGQRVENFRRALSGEVDLGHLLPSKWMPLTTVERRVAERIHVAALQSVSLPAEVTEAPHPLLDDEALRRSFLRQVGEVAGTAFINLARTLWNDHPDLAPHDWREPSRSEE